MTSTAVQRPAGPGQEAPRSWTSALEPVVAALLDDARRQADEDEQAARRAAAELEDRVAAEVDALVEQAAAAGRQAARRATSLALGAARRRARAVVLEARHRAFDGVRARAVEVLDERLRLSPEGRSVAADLAGAVARRLQVTKQEVVEDPGPPFVLHAARGRRQLSVDATVLVDASIETVLDELAEVWR